MMNSFNPMNSSMPGGSSFAKPVPNSEKNDSFDIDSLVKRIDAKIAELEEQEKQEQLKDKKETKELPKVEQKSVEKITQTNNIKDITTKENTVVKENVSNSNNKEVVNKIEPKIELEEEDNKVINGVTDDQFFDDFFNDED